MGTPQRKVRERRARRQAIQAAAVQVFGDKGYSRATMEDVARQAELSVGTIYLYYRRRSSTSRCSSRACSGSGKGSRRSWPRGSPPTASSSGCGTTSNAYHLRYPQSYRVLFFLQQPGLPAGLSPKALQEINVRAARNFPLVSRIVAAAMAKGIYRSREPREVVDLLWSLFLGLVHLSETRQNLGVTISTLRDLHAKAFRWLEEGLRAR